MRQCLLLQTILEFLLQIVPMFSREKFYLAPPIRRPLHSQSINQPHSNVLPFSEIENLELYPDYHYQMQPPLKMLHVFHYFLISNNHQNTPGLLSY